LLSAEGAGVAGDVAASPSKTYWGKIDSIWANLVRFGEIWKNLGKIWSNLSKIWTNLIRFGQNQNLASPKTFDLLRL